MGDQRRTDRRIDKINERLRDDDREGLKQDIAGSFMDDGTHTIIECSACGKQLCEIWVYRPTIKLRSTIVAKCGHCGDKSFAITISGQFSVGPVDGSAMSDMSTTNFQSAGDGWTTQDVIIETQPTR